MHERIDINKIVIKDRSRKSYGDIEGLAEDIRKNGLIHPPTVAENTYELIAGERRIRAMKLLGYKETDVTLISIRDAEHKIDLEISENVKRLSFNKEERISLARELERIEAAKARERQATSTGGIIPQLKENFPGAADGQVRDIVATKLGIGSGKQYEKEKFIVDHKDELTEDIYEQWKIGTISTGKIYSDIKKILSDREFANSEEALQLDNLRMISESFPSMEDLIDNGIVTKQIAAEITAALSPEEQMAFVASLDITDQIADEKASKLISEYAAKIPDDVAKLSKKNEQLEKMISLYEKSKVANETLIEDLSKQVEEYSKIKSDMIEMGLSETGAVNMYRAASEISQLNAKLQEMLTDVLSPIKYKPFMFSVKSNGALRHSFLKTLLQVKEWYDSMIEFVGEDESEFMQIEDYIDMMEE